MGLGSIGYSVGHLSSDGDHLGIRSSHNVEDRSVWRTVDRMGLNRSTMATIIEILGGIALTFGFGLLAIWAGLIVAGLLLILFGMALERFES